MTYKKKYYVSYCAEGGLFGGIDVDVDGGVETVEDVKRLNDTIKKNLKMPIIILNWIELKG